MRWRAGVRGGRSGCEGVPLLECGYTMCIQWDVCALFARSAPKRALSQPEINWMPSLNQWMILDILCIYFLRHITMGAKWMDWRLVLVDGYNGFLCSVYWCRWAEDLNHTKRASDDTEKAPRIDRMQGQHIIHTLRSAWMFVVSRDLPRIGCSQMLSTAKTEAPLKWIGNGQHFFCRSQYLPVRI